MMNSADWVPINVPRLRRMGTIRNFVLGGGGFHFQALIALENRSPKMTAICALAAVHSRGGIFQSFSARFKTRNRSFRAASSLGKCPLARTARRSFEFKASMALVTGMMMPDAALVRLGPLGL
ncbi:hypothetical protein M2351_003954 [Azospirillum canadense]|nr:hypothetical protein [Azospirillum canadense]